jgi:pyridoxine 5-phosphate synthase
LVGLEENLAAIPELVELNIGHAIVARAVTTGLGRAVAEMKRLMTAARGAAASRP